jgi:hypothetical protein
MLTTGSKWFAGLGVVSLVLAAAYGWTTGGNGLGPVTLGYHGGVGDHLGYGILVTAGVVALFLALVSVATRDADADALAQVAGTEVPPAATPPGSRTYWPLISAFGAALVALGLVAGSEMFIAGILVLAAVLVEWMVLAWSDRATGDPATNAALRDRLMRPLEYPIASFLAVGVVLFGFSRLFLTTSEQRRGGRRRRAGHADLRGRHRLRHPPQHLGEPHRRRAGGRGPRHAGPRCHRCRPRRARVPRAPRRGP